jgi:hypothetical protein
MADSERQTNQKINLLNEKCSSGKVTLTWSTDTLGIVVALLEKMMDTTNWELEPNFVVVLLEKMVDTTNWELEPNFPCHLVIALLNKRACAVSFSHLNTFLGQ